MVNKQIGFTLIELLIVMAIIALLLTIALPRYFGNIDRAKEAVLRQDLSAIRDAIDKYYADNGSYPEALSDLVDKHYLRAIPVDPMIERADLWRPTAPHEGFSGRIFDVHSASPGVGSDGREFDQW